MYHLQKELKDNHFKTCSMLQELIEEKDHYHYLEKDLAMDDIKKATEANNYGLGDKCIWCGGEFFPGDRILARSGEHICPTECSGEILIQSKQPDTKEEKEKIQVLSTI